MSINTKINFADKTNGFWDNFWLNKNGLGATNHDPDAECRELNEYHLKLWNRTLPNGTNFNLHSLYSGGYILKNKDFILSSDSLISGFRYNLYLMKKIINDLKQDFKTEEEYQKWQEEFTRKSYEIGGMIVFPKRIKSINQTRGRLCEVRDRIDLTIEAIRLYYEDSKTARSPLHETLKKDDLFFSLFVNFKEYIDFFFLQDIVSEDYKSVKMFITNNYFQGCALPKNKEEYKKWRAAAFQFITARNQRIEKYFKYT